MSTNLTLEMVVAAIREGHTLDYLRRMVGPSDEEKAEANRRHGEMSAIWKRNRPLPVEAWEWEDRNRYRQLDDEQAAFEEMYL